MRVLLAMVGKDLRRRARSPLPTILLLLFPLLFAGLIALTFGGSETKVPKVRLLIADEDGGLVGQFVTAAFQRGEAQTYFEVKTLTDTEKRTRAAALLEKEDATALLRLPAGLSNDVLAGRPARLELVKSPAQSILPDVAEQMTTVLAEGLSSASRLLRGPLDQIRGTPATPNGAPNNQRVAEIAVLVNGVVTRARPYVFPPVVTLETAIRPAPGPAKKGTGTSPIPSIFLLILPGISVFALFNLADQSMRDLLVEARLKTLRRQLAGPLTAGRVLAGKALATAAVAGLSLLLLTAVGAFVAAGALRGVSLAGYLLLSFALVAATTGFASFVFGLARNERQGATLASLVSLLMAFAGGSFIPLDSLPAALKILSPFSLMYWATRGYQQLVSEGLGVRAVLPNIAILAGTGFLLLALSAPLWQRRLLKGELA
ncbi:MAG TPA: ABC transporter permease [Thermoanaerobaculia bacterium]|jgi:ABC-2 type transport system permease protein|nr:ABC transporter permease [Thermoanaerobaculia bacterium]